MRSGAALNSQHASMTSSPLFIMVAESTEILRPITQLGWAQACAGVTRPNSDIGKVRNGPPEAVSQIRRTPALSRALSRSRVKSAGRHWKMALCSLSIGSSSAWWARTSSMNKLPVITSASLFASSTRLPALAAASVGLSPAAPTMAATTY